MSMINPSPKQHGTPRADSTYRRFRRANSIKWIGVETKYEAPPKLVKKVSKRGEVHYVTKDTEQI